MGKIRASMAFDKLSGTAGGVTVVQGRSGMVTQGPKTFRRHISPAQAAAMAHMATAGLAWEGLSDASVAAWRAYAQTIVRRGDVSGQSYSPLAFNVFSGLFCKLLQMNASATPPLWPPVGAFAGDSILVAATSGSGTLTYAASGPNRAGVVTELLVQKLPGRHRLPKPKSKSAGFASFSPGHLTFTLPVEPGYYFCSYAFVESATGRATAMVPIGTVHVP